MNSRDLLRFFHARRERDEAMVLATVVETGGSTYSKRGEMMLIDERGSFVGMLSGGCLEGDLAERSVNVLDSGQPSMVEFDLRQDDEVFGLGVGCEGTLQVYLQRIHPAADYSPFDAIVDAMGQRKATTVTIADDHDIVVVPPPKLLVLGAGADSEPLVNMVAELGWPCTVTDHRPAYIASRRYAKDIKTVVAEASTIAAAVTLSDFDMALVMSHHLASDRAYLRALAQSDVGYIGLLGPPSRRDRILDELGEIAARLKNRLRAPAGMQLGLRGAGPIAVEILAEMQTFLASSRDEL